MSTPASSLARSPAVGFKDECVLHGLQACMLCRLREAKQGAPHASLPTLALQNIRQASNSANDSGVASRVPPVNDGHRSSHGLGASLESITVPQRASTDTALNPQPPVLTTASARGITYESEQNAPRNFSADLILHYSDKLLAELLPRSENRQQGDTTLIVQRHKQKNTQRQRKHDSAKLNKLTTKDAKSPYATNGIVHARN
jgi:hypothetical protein